MFGGTKYVLDSDTLEYSPESLTDFSKLVRHMKEVPELTGLNLVKSRHLEQNKVWCSIYLTVSINSIHLTI